MGQHDPGRTSERGGEMRQLVQTVTTTSRHEIKDRGGSSIVSAGESRIFT
jgi:hypothetical protein